MFSAPVAATRPAVTSSESPGRKNPRRSPVSAKTMATRSPYPPHRMSESSCAPPRSSSPRTSNGALLAPCDSADRAMGHRRLAALDPHAVERAPHEHHREHEEDQSQRTAQP